MYGWRNQAITLKMPRTGLPGSPAKKGVLRLVRKPLASKTRFPGMQPS